MKMPNMVNGRDGFSCALNPVGDIFQRGTLPFETEASIDLGDASQEKKVLVGQIADSATSFHPFRREMRFWREMPKDLYHLYQMNKLDCISEAYTGTGHLYICTKAVPTCTTYTQGKASSELIKAATYKAKVHSRSQTPHFLAGPLSLIFSSVKVTASEESKPYAGVTVSMTSEDAAGYGKCDSGSHLSSPKLASAKYRQHRSPMPGVTVTSRNAINGLASAHMVGVCPDNLLNIKAESAFFQAAGKEKGPEVNPALLSTSMISCTGESNELHHNSHLQATGFAQCQQTSQALGSMPRDCNSFLIIRFIHPARLSSPSCFCASSIAARSSGSKRNWKGGLPRLSFMCVDMSITPEVVCLCVMTRYYHMQQKTTKPGSASTLTGHLTTSDRFIIEVAMDNYTALIGRDKPSFTQTRPKFTDTYWIVPCYETTPYGKVSFTRQDRRTFIAMFKDSRLIWAGRQPVKDLTENVICTQLQKEGVKHTRSPKECLKDPESQKVDVKRSANPTSSVKETESRSQFNQSPGLLVRKMPHEGIEEISISQGGVNIAPPSTITEIVTVQEVAHV